MLLSKNQGYDLALHYAENAITKLCHGILYKWSCEYLPSEQRQVYGGSVDREIEPEPESETKVELELELKSERRRRSKNKNRGREVEKSQTAVSIERGQMLENKLTGNNDSAIMNNERYKQ